MAEVDFHQDLEALIQSWKTMFERHHKSAPRILKDDKRILGEALREYGLLKAEGLLCAYLDMKTPFYLKRAHPLTIFQEDVNKVIAQYGKSSQTLIKETQVRIKANSWCSKCKKDFVFEGPPHELERGVCRPCLDW